MRQFTQINFCNSCGARISLLVPEGDNRERHVCPECGWIQYQNPKVVCGCIPLWQDRVLLCRRAIEPRYGYWTLPAGFMENGETLEQGAARETQEEACAEIGEMRLFGVYSLPRACQVYVMFMAQLKRADGFSPGSESLDAQLFLEAEIPWDEIAFRVITRTLQHYFGQRKSAHFAATGELSVVTEKIV